MCVQVDCNASTSVRNTNAKLLKSKLNADISAVQAECLFMVHFPQAADHDHHYTGPVSFFMPYTRSSAPFMRAGIEIDL